MIFTTNIFKVKKYFRLPTNVDEKIPTPAQCCKTIMEKTAMDKATARELAEKVNDHLRYKLVQLRVQKMLHLLAGSTAPSKTTVVNSVQSRGWTDVARIVDSTISLWKPAPVSENRRSTRNTPLEDTTSNSPNRGYNMFFCNFTNTIINMQKVAEFVISQHWPFLQICEKIVFDNGACGRGVILTAPIKKHEIVCDYHTDMIITQSVMCQRENTQYILDCGDIIFDATSDTCECHPGRRTFGRLLNYRPDSHPQCNVRMKRMVINGKNVILFIAKRDIDFLEEICFDYKDPKCKTEFFSRPPQAAVSVASETPINRQFSNQSTSDELTSEHASDPPTPGPSSDPPTLPASDPPTPEPSSNPPTLPASQMVDQADPPTPEPSSDPPTSLSASDHGNRAPDLSNSLCY